MPKIFLGGDTHCGSVVGLTPPKWQQGYYSNQQAEMWTCWRRNIRKHKPFDIAIWNGDMIDGKSSRTGSTDLITADRREQVKMAMTCIETVDAPVNLLTYGTPYHVGNGEDWEGIVADYVKGKIKNHHYFDIAGVSFSVRHKVGSSSIPHGRFTPLAKEHMWDTIWANEKEQHPQSRVIIRSHVHFHNHCGKKGPDWWLAMTLPALQGLGSKYGARQCSGTVDFGFVWMEVERGRVKQWDAEITVLDTHKNEVLHF